MPALYRINQRMKTKTNVIGVTYMLAGVILAINQNLAFAQPNNASSNVTGATTATTTTIPTLTKPGEKEFYIFTAEIPDVDEEKLKVAGDSFSLTTMIVNKGNKDPSSISQLPKNTTSGANK